LALGEDVALAELDGGLGSGVRIVDRCHLDLGKQPVEGAGRLLIVENCTVVVNEGQIIDGAVRQGGSEPAGGVLTSR